MTKQDIKDDFIKFNCLGMWHEYYDDDYITITNIIGDCELRQLMYSKLPISELTRNERNFIEMIKTWE